MKPGAGTSLLAGSLLLVLAPSAHALTLGDINVRSALGQPLNATVPVRLGAGEALASGCVMPGQKASDLRRVPGARVTTPEAAREGQFELRVSSASALYEPMYELELEVKCPGAPVVVRQYVLMLDLPGAMASFAAPTREVSSLQPVTTASGTVSMPRETPSLPAVQARAAQPRATVNRAGATIASGSAYRVSDGDSLSAISARVRDRKISLRALADAIQAANPAAFIRNDPNLIKLGSVIQIPDAVGGADATATLPSMATTPVVAPAPAIVTVPPLATTPEVLATTQSSSAVAEDFMPARQLPVAQIDVTQAQTPEVPVAPTRVTRQSVAAKAAPPESTGANNADGANPFFAAAAGVLVGLCVSALLWFRERLPSRKRRAAGKVAEAKSASKSNPAAFSTVVQPLVTRSVEPGFSVSYSTEYDDSLDGEFSADPEATAIAAPIKAPPKPAKASPNPAPAATDEITSELEKLFDGTDTTIRKRLDAENAMAAHSTDIEAIGELESAEIDSDDAVDFLVGEPPEYQDLTMASQTKELARTEEDSTSDSGTVDIHALATAATKDEQQAQTLLEALTLLERDYEAELTASQVLDMSAVRRALGDEFDESTKIGEALPRKKAR